MGIRSDLLDTISAFVEANGREPEKLFLTRDDEQRLATMSRDEAGGDTSGNVREQWSKIAGVEVVWDSDHRHCE